MSEKEQASRKNSARYSPRVLAGVLQRKCACGTHTMAGTQCEACGKKHERMLSRKAVSPSHSDEAPAIVHDVLGSPGQPLDAETRAFFEPRFGHDFSNVRVHTEETAAESARAVNALAYTVGRDLVFGSGQYAPRTETGRALVAHELTHVVQQSASAGDQGPLRLSDPSEASEQQADAAAQTLTLRDSQIQMNAPTASRRILQRACGNDPECKPAAPGRLPGSAVKGSVEHFVTETKREVTEAAVTANKKTPRELREDLCNKTPPDPGCTADGHARRATAFEELFAPRAPALKSAAGVFVDKDIEKNFGAYVKTCGFFTPPIPGDNCIFIPEHLELEAALYKKGAKTIDGKDRDKWLNEALTTITHEVEHVRFRKEFPKTEPSPGACKFKDVQRELTELAANMSEFPLFFKSVANKNWGERRDALHRWFKYKISQPQKHGEAFAGMLKAIRCRCECVDADAYIKRTVDFTTASWTEDEKNTFHAEMRNPQWKLDWPIVTPPPPRDIPGATVGPSAQIGFGYLGSAGISLGAGLNVGIPLDRLGKWQMLLAAQGRMIVGLHDKRQEAYVLGLKFGFLRGPALGSRGLRVGAFGEAGGGYFLSHPQPGPVEGKGGAYAGGGLHVEYDLGREGRLMPFVGLDVAGGAANLGKEKSDVQGWFTTGFGVGVRF